MQYIAVSFKTESVVSSFKIFHYTEDSISNYNWRIHSINERRIHEIWRIFHYKSGCIILIVYPVRMFCLKRIASQIHPGPSICRHLVLLNRHKCLAECESKYFMGDSEMICRVAWTQYAPVHENVILQKGFSCWMPLLRARRSCVAMLKPIASSSF